MIVRHGKKGPVDLFPESKWFGRDPTILGGGSEVTPGYEIPPSKLLLVTASAH